MSAPNVADPTTGTLRVCGDRCSDCIYRPGNLMNLDHGRLDQLTQDAIANEGHIVCHQTLDSPAAAICAGYAQHPLGAARSRALRLARAGILRIIHITPKGAP